MDRKRQYIHRLNKWRVKKYNKTARRPLLAPDSSLRPRLLAEALRALGDPSSSFTIIAQLCKAAPSTLHIVTCALTAQTESHANAVQDILQENTDSLLDRDKDHSSANFLFDILWALTDVRKGAAREPNDDGICQIEDIMAEWIREIEGRERLKELAPLGRPPLDVPLIVALDSALVQFNRYPAFVGNHIDATHVLQQLIDQQPAVQGRSDGMRTGSPPPDIDCLPSCLTRCMEVLESRPAIPAAIRGAGGDDRITEAYKVLCTLWHSVLNPLAAPEPTWAPSAESQLGISATHLLGLVVCMIMAAAPQQQQQQGSMHDNNNNNDDAVIDRALAGARALEDLTREELIRRFLNQALATNRRLLIGPGPHGHPNTASGADAARMIVPFRLFVAQSLQVTNELPALAELAEDAVVYPLVLAEPDQFLGTPSASGSSG